MHIFPLAIVCVSLLVRCCFIFSPHSGQGKPPLHGDFEAQRHWMEVSVNLPISEWYRNTSRNDLQYWGLDYPPLSAYTAYWFGLSARALLPDFVAEGSSRGSEAPVGKLFMRLTVMACDILIFFPSILILARVFQRLSGGENEDDGRDGRRRKDAEEEEKRKPRSTKLTDVTSPDVEHRGSWRKASLMALLVFLSPGFILIDHGHFQYNNVALGFTALAAGLLLNGWESSGSSSSSRSKMLSLVGSSISFSLALNFKQTLLYFSPAFFVAMLAMSVNRGYSHLTILSSSSHGSGDIDDGVEDVDNGVVVVASSEHYEQLTDGGRTPPALNAQELRNRVTRPMKMQTKTKNRERSLESNRRRSTSSSSSLSSSSSVSATDVRTDLAKPLVVSQEGSRSWPSSLPHHSPSSLQVLLATLVFGLPAIMVFVVLWSPFCFYAGAGEDPTSCVEGLYHVFRRLFPFDRSLFEGKVANLWCAVDPLLKLRNRIYEEAAASPPSTLTLSSSSSLFSVRSLTSYACIFLTLALMSPSLVSLWRHSQGKGGAGGRGGGLQNGSLSRTRERFSASLLHTLLNTSLAFFLASYQVHEKAILLPLLPLTLLSLRLPGLALWGILLCTWTLWPLLKLDGLLVAAGAVTALYVSIFALVMRMVEGEGRGGGGQA